MKKVILSVAVLAVIFTGCKKNDDDPAPSKTKTELLTANTWILSGATADKSVDYDGNGNSSIDVFSQMDACEKDDFTIFLNNDNIKSGISYEGALPCNGGTANDVYAFTWAFNSTETILTTSFDGDSSDVILVELTDTTLKISYTAIDSNDLSYIKTVTLTKK